MNSYTGVWRAGSHRHYLWANVTWSSFSAQADDLDGSGGGDGSRDIMLGDATSADAHGAEPSEGAGFGGGEW